jgi:hypothetical protein
MEIAAMARRTKRRSVPRISGRPIKKKSRQTFKRKIARSSRQITKKRRPGVSNARLERGLRVLAETRDIKTAARSIRVSAERFERAAKRKAAIQKRKGFWTVVRRLPRKMPLFSGGRQLAITVKSNSATLSGRYMSAVRQFLRSNDPKFLDVFKGLSVKDARGKVYPLETDPNVLYRLSSAGNEPFEEIYRIVI